MFHEWIFINMFFKHVFNSNTVGSSDQLLMRGGGDVFMNWTLTIIRVNSSPKIKIVAYLFYWPQSSMGIFRKSLTPRNTKMVSPLIPEASPPPPNRLMQIIPTALLDYQIPPVNQGSSLVSAVAVWSSFQFHLEQK